MSLDMDTSLALHELQVELPQECDFLGDCTEPVEWEANCTLCKGYAYVCDTHRRVLAHNQSVHAGRRGMRCPVCEGVSTDLLMFSPVRSRDEGKLW